MGNSFNIAADLGPTNALITIVDAVVDNIRAVDVVNLANQNTAIDLVVDAIRAVDVPALSDQNVAIDTVVDAIRATDITTITNAITAKKIRGELKHVTNTTTAADYEDLLNISGSGKLVAIIMDIRIADENERLRLTIDNEVFNHIILDGIAKKFICFDTNSSQNKDLKAYDTPVFFNTEFNTALRIEHYRSAGAGCMLATAYYQEDA